MFPFHFHSQTTKTPGKWTALSNNVFVFIPRRLGPFWVKLKHIIWTSKSSSCHSSGNENRKWGRTIMSKEMPLWCNRSQFSRKIHIQSELVLAVTLVMLNYQSQVVHMILFYMGNCSSKKKYSQMTIANGVKIIV